MAAPRKADKGRDVKSLAINLASILLISLPFIAYIDLEYGMYFGAAVVVSFVLAFLIPPIGWMRPHPYSDIPRNKPYPRRDD